MPANTKTILIADDEPDLRTVLAGLLREEGWEVIEAKNGDEAVTMAAFHQPDVVVLDVMMPIKDGFHAYKEIREDHRTEHIPVIMLTAVNEHELGMNHDVQSMGLRLGLDPPQAFIEKPIDANRLRRTLADILGE